MGKDEGFYFIYHVETVTDQGARARACEHYIAFFPQGKHAAQAFYEIADYYYSTGEYKKSNGYYKKVGDEFADSEWGRKAREKLDGWEDPIEIIKKNLATEKYEFGWSGGAANTGNASKASYYPILNTSIRNTRIVMRYSWKNGVLDGVLAGNTYKGSWVQSNGRGNFSLTFNADFSKASGWWNNGRDSPKHPAL